MSLPDARPNSLSLERTTCHGIPDASVWLLRPAAGDEGSLDLLDFATVEILRFAPDRPLRVFAQNGSLKAFFPSLLSRRYVSRQVLAYQ